MRLSQTSVFRLDYDPATDILQVNYASFQNFDVSEVIYSLQLLVEAIRTYDVKKVLLDASRSTIEVGDEQSKSVTIQFLSDLALTHIQKVARIKRVDAHTENAVLGSMEHLKEVGLLPFQLRTFSGADEAIKWLMDDTENLPTSFHTNLSQPV